MTLGDDFTPDPPQPWMDDALCAEVATEIFFPEKGGSTKAAKDVCAKCPVAEQCLDYALANEERHGIWGGLSERERRKLRAGLPRPRRTAIDPAAVQRLHAQGLMDTEIAASLAVTEQIARRARRALNLPANGRGGKRKDAFRVDPRDRSKKKEVPVMAETKPAKWAVRKAWVAVSPDGVLHGPFDGQPAAVAFVGAQPRPDVASTPPVAASDSAARALAAHSPRALAGAARKPRRPWTEDEVQAVRDLHTAGLTDSAIARRLDRAQPDVSRYRRKLGLTPHASFGGAHTQDAAV